MLSNLSEDRRRILFSGGIAAVLHVVVLIAIGLNSEAFTFEPEYGPVTVQISLDRPNERLKEPDPVESFDAGDAPEAAAVLPEPEISAVPEPVSQPVTEPVMEASEAATPGKSAPEIIPAADDYNPVEAIQNRAGGSSGGLDARSVFGDDPVPAVTDHSSSAAASYFSDNGDAGSAIVLSDAKPAENRPTAAAAESPAEVSVVSDSAFDSLDSRLSSFNSSADETISASHSTVESSKVFSGNIEGSSHQLSFEDQSLSRTPMNELTPEIPEDVQKAGISEYEIVISFYIDPDGITSSPQIDKPSGNSNLDAALIRAVRAWVFRESSTVGKKVRATLTYVIKLD
ncbi:MAG: TonB family protein [Spirochaetales bacterium]|uniref:TonB family protein n=1 Tax=Candidatus Thalassospirochaeta sargassi TaxID=3119039 RepID=A0AAJ1I9P2_9SPIO|nr:TonB family protein [Spirochaetales bacterium]